MSAFLLFTHVVDDDGERRWKFEALYYSEADIRQDFRLYESEHDLLVLECEEGVAESIGTALALTDPSCLPAHENYDEEAPNVHWCQLATATHRRTMMNNYGL